MAQQRGMKRAQKVLKRKQQTAKAKHQTNLKKLAKHDHETCTDESHDHGKKGKKK